MGLQAIMLIPPPPPQKKRERGGGGGGGCTSIIEERISCSLLSRDDFLKSDFLALDQFQVTGASPPIELELCEREAHKL